MMPVLTAVTLNGAPILGSFSKALPGGVAFNYGQSGGADCDRSCTYHPDSTSPHVSPDTMPCYAWKGEKRWDRQRLKAKQARHQATDRDELTAGAYAEVKRRRQISWFRFSAFGSCPAKPPRLFRELCEHLSGRKIGIHLPLESWAKTRRYRKELKGLKVAVRRSCQSVRAFLRASTNENPISVVAGSLSDTPRQRVAIALKLAAQRAQRTGRKCIVCPAVAVVHLRLVAPKAKCGAGGCTGCANDQWDIVYPAHK